MFRNLRSNLNLSDIWPLLTMKYLFTLESITHSILLFNILFLFLSLSLCRSYHWSCTAVLDARKKKKKTHCGLTWFVQNYFPWSVPGTKIILSRTLSNKLHKYKFTISLFLFLYPRLNHTEQNVPYQNKS